MFPSVLTSISITNSVVSLPGLPFDYFMRRPLKKPLFVVVLSYVRSLALLCRIHISLLEALAGWNLGMVARAFLTAVGRRNWRHVSMLGHESSTDCSRSPEAAD